MDLDNLTLEDCMCSICMCIFVEPVTMPCTHTLCMPCFKQNVEATSLTCPLCRKRISTWARKAARDKTLINSELWIRIKSMFPDKVEKRLDGEDQEDESEMEVFHPIINLAQPGEIRQEYEEQLKRLEKERELERQREIEASEALIRRLERERQVKSVDQQMIEERDQELARELENVVNEAGTDSPFNILLKESRNRLTRSRGSSTTSSKQSPLTIQSFIQKMRDAEKLKAADRLASRSGQDSPYPYTCYTPSDKDQSSRPSTVTFSSRSSAKSSTSCTSYNTDADIEWEIVNTNNDAAASNDSKSVKGDKRPAQTVTCTARSASAMSSDSINQELNHFKPIKICPLTPPKINANGKIVETQVIRTTPRNLMRTDSFSPSTANSLSDIDAGSPVMRRRLSELEEERKSQVMQNSKATETSSNAEDKKNDIAKYFTKRSKASSPSENIPSLDKAIDQPKIQLKKAIIPLEPIFDNVDDIHDFDDAMAPLMEIKNLQTRPPLRQKPVKPRQRNVSRHEDISNNSILTPQRSIRDWLSGTLSPNSAVKVAYKDFNRHHSSDNNSSLDTVVDSKEGILDAVQTTQIGSNKLQLKSYPKRKHKAYHVSDYVYPKLSPRKRESCIQISSDEEFDKDEIDSDKESIECPLLPVMKKPNLNNKETNHSLRNRKRKRVNVSQERGLKKLKSARLSKHQDKRIKTMHTFLRSRPKRRRVSGGSSHSSISCHSSYNEMPHNESIMSEKEAQEEADRQLALELEKMFKLEGKGKLSAIRIKGSDNEYSFRRKVKT